MKKLLRFADIIVLLCGTLGLILQLWIRLTGTDDKNLYDPHHPGWLFGWALTLVTLTLIWLLTRRVGNNRSYKANFPPSVLGALACLAAAAAFLYSGYTRLQTSTMWLDTLAGFAGLLSSAGLLMAADSRLRGSKPPFYCFMLPCVFFALQIFYLGWKLGGEPESIRFLFPFLATLSMIPACYQLWGFCVGSGSRKDSLFWSLLAGFLCMLAAPAEEGGVIYLLLAFWLLSNLCTLKYLPRPSRPAPQPEAEAEAETEPDANTAPPEVPSTMDEEFPQPSADAEEVPAPNPAEEPALDADVIIAEILQQIDSNIE